MNKSYYILVLIAVIGLLVYVYGLVSKCMWLLGAGVLMESSSFIILVVQVLIHVFSSYGGGEYALHYFLLTLTAIVLLIIVVFYMIYIGVSMFFVSE